MKYSNDKKDKMFSIKRPNICNNNKSRYLVIMPLAIGDAIAIGSSAIDQIILNDHHAYGAIDILCSKVQSHLFQCDPRIRRMIIIKSDFFHTPGLKTLYKTLFLPSQTRLLADFLRQQHYQAIYPGMTTPAFYNRLQAPIMRLNNLRILCDTWAILHKGADIPISKMTRQVINDFFHNVLSEPVIDAEIPLYLDQVYIQQAVSQIKARKQQAEVADEKSSLILVAPDTSSFVSRPPATLLAQALNEVLQQQQDVLALILPAYTDTTAPERLYQQLDQHIKRRVILLPAEPRPQLLEIAALIDQTDVFITGDTGVMHMAVATKYLSEEAVKRSQSPLPRNAVQIIALFGGTNAGIHGYSTRTIILGQGRKEQSRLVPGIFKENYRSTSHDLFDHISPHQLAHTVLSCLKQNVFWQSDILKQSSS